MEHNFAQIRTIFQQWLKLQRKLYRVNHEINTLNLTHNRCHLIRWIHAKEAMIRHYRHYGSDDDQDWEIDFLKLSINKLQKELNCLSGV